MRSTGGMELKKLPAARTQDILSILADDIDTHRKYVLNSWRFFVAFGIRHNLPQSVTQQH